jgi:hypothetical protein
MWFDEDDGGVVGGRENTKRELLPERPPSEDGELATKVPGGVTCT